LIKTSSDETKTAQLSYGEVQSQAVKRGRGYRKYHAEVSNRFAMFKNLDTEVEINSA
jgi:hypothetical protein